MILGCKGVLAGFEWSWAGIYKPLLGWIVFAEILCRRALLAWIMGLGNRQNKKAAPPCYTAGLITAFEGFYWSWRVIRCSLFSIVLSSTSWEDKDGQTESFPPHLPKCVRCQGRPSMYVASFINVLKNESLTKFQNKLVTSIHTPLDVC